MYLNGRNPKLPPLYELARLEIIFRFDRDSLKSKDVNYLVTSLEQWKDHLKFVRELGRGVLWRGNPKNKIPEMTLDELMFFKITTHFRESLAGKWNAVAAKMKETGVDYKKTYEFFFPGSRTAKDYHEAKEYYKQYMLDNPEQEGLKPL